MPWSLTLLAAFATCSVAALSLATLAAARWLEQINPAVGEFVGVDGLRLHVLDLRPENVDESAPAILLLHGANLDLRDMSLALGARLARRFRVIIPDRPGQGHSTTGGVRALPPEKQAALFRNLLRERGVERVIVVGHSFGGFIALCYALQSPDDVAGLALINPTSHPRPTDLLWYQRLAAVVLGSAAAYTIVTPLSFVLNAAFVKRLFAPGEARVDYAALSGLALGMTPRRFLASMKEYEGLRDALVRHAPLYRNIAARTVVVSGSEDIIAPTALHAEKLKGALQNATLLKIEGAGHMAHHTHAERVVAEIEALTSS
jgi:pimeloyl-ACP methyl ester carboxylesterase